MRTWSEWKAQLCAGHAEAVIGDDWVAIPGVPHPDDPQAPLIIRSISARVLALAVVCPTRTCDLALALRLGAELALGAPIVIADLLVLRHVIDPGYVPTPVADRELALLAFEAAAMRELLVRGRRPSAGDGSLFAAYAE